MTPIEWYWFVEAPIIVTGFGVLIGVIGVRLIEWTDRSSDPRVLKQDSNKDGELDG